MTILDTIKNKLSNKEVRIDGAFLVYGTLVGEARSPTLFKAYNIPDTIDGRFDAIVLYISLFLIGAGKTLDASGKAEMGRDVVGIFLKDMDRNLREIGVGDLGVGKQVNKMASGLYGRLKAYDNALSGKNPEKEMTIALTRNLYRDEKVKKSAAPGLARHSLKVLARMQQLDIDNILAGNLSGEGK